LITANGTATGQGLFSSGLLVAGGNVNTAFPSITSAVSNFSDANDQFTITGHGLSTGSRVRFYGVQEGALLPLVDGGLYFVINTGANTFKLAGTAADPVLHGRLTGRREIWRWLIAGVFALFFADFFLSTLRPPEAAVPGAKRGWRERAGDWLGRAVGNSAVGDTMEMPAG
jgi:hypothetical protein